ncbi:MAG: hypothetical protein WCQ63_04070 [Methanomethylophilus sp.]|nr:hypothetical protein [Methanomethylophilus sp.]
MTPRSRNILAVIIACALLLSAGAAAYTYHDNRSEETTSPHDVTITDSLGNQVTVTALVTSICTVNTNAAEFFEVLGVEDRVVSADSATISSLSEIYGNVLDVGSYKTPSGKKIAESGAAIVVSQSSARSLSSATEQALKDNYGITVLRLDCYGETMLNDVEQLVKIMDSDSAENAYDGCVSTYDSVKDQVLKLSESCSGDPSYLMYFTSMGRYYNENSERSSVPFTATMLSQT